jgi:hypothetical protein
MQAKKEELKEALKPTFNKKNLNFFMLYTEAKHIHIIRVPSFVLGKMAVSDNCMPLLFNLHLFPHTLRINVKAGNFGEYMKRFMISVPH